MPQALSNEDVRSMFIGYPIALGGMWFICLQISRNMTSKAAASSQKVSTQTVVGELTVQTSESTEECDQPASGNDQVDEVSIDVEQFKTLSLIAVVSLLTVDYFQLYLFFRFGLLVVRHASEDFTAKMISLFWTVILGAVAWFNTMLIGESLGLVPVKHEGMAGTGSDTDMPFTTELNSSHSTPSTSSDASWDNMLADAEERMEEPSPKESDTLNVLEGNEQHKSIAEETSPEKPWALTIVIYLYGLGILTLLIPFVRLVFA